MKRFLRLFTFAIISLVVIFVVLNFGLAWILVTAMTHPLCQTPHRLAVVPIPEEHWLMTKDGISIRIWYYPSQNGAAILTFGGMGGSLGNHLPPVTHLIQAGYGVVQVDSRACAQPAATVTQGHDEVWDAEAALAFLANRSEINPQRIGAMGFSMGGAAALRAAAHHAEIRAVVRDGGFSSLGELLSPKETQSFAERIQQSTIMHLYKFRSGIDPWQVDPNADITRIDPRPVFLIYGEHEAADGRKQIEAGGKNVTLWIVPNGTHGRNHLAAPEEYVQRTIDFFDQNLLK